MGSDTSRFIILMVFSSLLSSIVCGGSSGSYDTKALDALFWYYANQTLNEHRRTGKPISIRFPFVETKEKNVTRLKCVVFGKNGSFVLKNMTKRDVCVTEKAGHFCVVTRTKSSKPEKEEGSEGLEMVGDRVVGLGGSEDVEMVEREEDQRHGEGIRFISGVGYVLGQGKS